MAKQEKETDEPHLSAPMMPPAAKEKAAMNGINEKLRDVAGLGTRSEVEFDLRNRFTHHAPKPGQTELYTAIREMALQFAIAISRYTPSGREQSRALTYLEEAVFWANASIARK